MEALESFYKNPTKNILFDFGYRDDTTLILKTEALAKIFSHLSIQKKKRSPEKTAIVAPGDLRFGISRIAEAFAEKEKLRWEMKAFRSIHTAIHWLAAVE
jgi:hypothetical protein